MHFTAHKRLGTPGLSKPNRSGHEYLLPLDGDRSGENGLPGGSDPCPGVWLPPRERGAVQARSVREGVRLWSSRCRVDSGPLADAPGLYTSTSSISLSRPRELIPVLIPEARILKAGAGRLKASWGRGPATRLLTDMLIPSSKLRLDVRELDGQRSLRVRHQSATSDLLVGCSRRRSPGQVSPQVDNWGVRPFHVKHFRRPRLRCFT
jgi:hypothetical protein